MFEIVFYSDKLDKNQTGWFNGSNRLCSTHSYSDKQIQCTWSKQLDVRFGGFQTLLFFPLFNFHFNYVKTGPSYEQEKRTKQNMGQQKVDIFSAAKLHNIEIKHL